MVVIHLMVIATAEKIVRNAEGGRVMTKKGNHNLVFEETAATVRKGRTNNVTCLQRYIRHL